MTIWCQTLNGRAFDLLDPRADAVDLREVAFHLSTINRYAGAAESVVSVAMHTLIAAAEAPPSLRPWVLVHDAHEAYIGDWPTPAKQALIAAAEAHGPSVRNAMDRLTARLNRAIWEAAGLCAPTPEQRRMIKFYDVRALMTERRDFLAPAPRPWDATLEAVGPAKRVYRAQHFGRTPFDVGALLWNEFQTWLPAFRAGGSIAAKTPTAPGGAGGAKLETARP